MTRIDDMLERYGECVTISRAAQIINRSRPTVRAMLNDGRLREVCAGTMVDVRSIAEYIEAPAEADTKARQFRGGRRWSV